MTRTTEYGDDIVLFVERAAETDPDGFALIFEDGTGITRKQLWDGAKGFAGYLSTLIGPTDRVAIMSSNRCEFMMVWIAVVACRGELVSMNPTVGHHDAGHILRDSGATVVVTEAAHTDLFEGLRSECPDLKRLVVLGADEPHGLDEYQRPFELDRPSSAAMDVTNIFYTSGTTGTPKGCMVDHAYWIHFASLVSDAYDFTGADRMLCCLQFFYNDPPWQLLISLQAGSPLVSMRRFSVSRYWNVVRDFNVTILFGIASTASLLLKAPLDGNERSHNVRLALHVGIPKALHRELVDRWGVPWVEGYGLTETGLIIMTPVSMAGELIGSGSIGMAASGVDVKVVDDEGRDVPSGTTGEIVVKGPGLMRGYLNRPEATAETMRNGWLHTGDLGSRDDKGLYYFLGRKKDVIRRNGENIAAAEVENVLRSHPQVLEAAVVPAIDELRGEEVKVHVLLKPGETPTTAPAKDLVEYCASQLARYKVPRYLEFRSTEFDRTPSMRVKKQELSRDTQGEGVWDREAELGW
ncbi:MAG: AMP-binding protein [Nitrospiraceae bacterium]|nr:AMP-binding protein [Nitrospiraceae bacterium]